MTYRLQLAINDLIVRVARWLHQPRLVVCEHPDELGYWLERQ